jgi:uncharacterized protein with HEPN domain
MVKKPTNPEAFLYHILESIEAINRFVEGYDKNDLLKDEKTQNAVIGMIEIIGEAARNLPSAFRKNNTEIPWEKISSMRNKLIHEYFGVDLFLVWETIKKDLPILKKQIRKIIKQQKL